jgi:hypothetical protein
LPRQPLRVHADAPIQKPLIVDSDEALSDLEKRETELENKQQLRQQKQWLDMMNMTYRRNRCNNYLKNDVPTSTHVAQTAT